MIKITVKLDDAELITMIKEEWYKKARHQTAMILENKSEEMICRYLNENASDFKVMFKEALQFELKQYTIRDMKVIEKLIKDTAQKSTTERKKRS